MWMCMGKWLFSVWKHYMVCLTLFPWKTTLKQHFLSLCLSAWCTNNSLLYCLSKQGGRLWGHCLGVMGLLCCLRKEQFVWIRIGWFCFLACSFLISRVWFPHFIIHNTHTYTTLEFRLRQCWLITNVWFRDTWLQEWLMNYLRGMNGWLVMFDW